MPLADAADFLRDAARRGIALAVPGLAVTAGVSLLREARAGWVRATGW